MIRKFPFHSQNQDFGAVFQPDLGSLGELLAPVLSVGVEWCEERLPGVLEVVWAINRGFLAKNWILADFGPDL